MHISEHLITAAREAIDSYSGTGATVFERSLLNALSDIVTEAERQQAEKEAQRKEGAITTPVELRDVFYTAHKMQLLDYTDTATWKSILDWADSVQDEHALVLAEAFKRAHRDDKPAVMEDLFRYVSQNFGNETYSEDRTTNVSILLYGGGPSGGIDFVFDADGELTKGFAWHNDFGRYIEYVLPIEDAERLRDTYDVYVSAENM